MLFHWSPNMYQNAQIFGKKTWRRKFEGAIMKYYSFIYFNLTSQILPTRKVHHLGNRKSRDLYGNLSFMIIGNEFLQRLNNIKSASSPLARTMANIGLPKHNRRPLITEVMKSLLLYAAVWTLNNRVNRRKVN